MESNVRPVSRRNFLNFILKALLSLSGILGVGGILQFLGYQTEPAPPTRFNLGEISNFPPGSRVIIPEALAIVQHSPEGLKAYSLVCPHLGCTIEPKDDGFDCPCHGSKFYENGTVRNGPASEALTEYRLEESVDGLLILYTD